MMGLLFILAGILLIYLTWTNKLRPLMAAIFNLNPNTK